MALEVGKDSYVTLEEAENYIEKYITDKNLLKSWGEKSPEEKEVLLRTSCRDLDNLKYKGKKKNISQKLQFPRVVTRSAGYGYRRYISQFVDNGIIESGSYNDGLESIKQAQVENALYHSCVGDIATEQIGLNIKGLVAKKAGPIAESYDRNSEINRDALNGIYTPKVYAILVDWLTSSKGVV